MLKARLKKLYIKRFIEELVPDVKVVFTSESWYYKDDELDKAIISINLDSEDTDKLFNEFTNKAFNIEINYLLASILHEVGHYYTFNDFDKFTKEMVLNIAETELYNGKLSLKDVQYIYFNTTLEYNATKWAMDYYKANEKKCKDFLRKMNLPIDTIA